MSGFYGLLELSGVALSAGAAVAGLTPEEAIRALLVADADVAALVSDRASTGYAEQEFSRPYITITRIAGDHTHHLRASGGLVVAVIEVEYHAKRKLDVADLAEKGRLALDGFRGYVTTGGKGFTAQLMHLKTGKSDFVRDRAGNDTGLARVSHEYLVGYAEAIPTFN
jgi:hypothetical protein